jgi:hypothetical protein
MSQIVNTTANSSHCIYMQYAIANDFNPQQSIIDDRKTFHVCHYQYDWIDCSRTT